MSTFRADTYQNEYLPVGGTRVEAIVTVTATGTGGRRVGTQAAEIIIVDTSGSMSSPRSKIRGAKEATAVAVDCIGDGVLFAIVAGTNGATQIYPKAGLVAASPDTRSRAKVAIDKLVAGGGTAIGQWLTHAHDLFMTHPAEIRHAILLTDGENEGETEAELDRVLAVSGGAFQCDCRGVGDEWKVPELRKIASALLGTVDVIPEPEDMPAEFRAMMERAMAKETGDVALRIWSPQGASVAFVKQVAPVIEDLTARRAVVSDQVGDYLTGAWGDESRDYHVSINVPARDIGEEMLAARVSLVVAGEVLSEAKVRAVWTDDERLSTVINREVAHYTGQVEMAAAIEDGLAAMQDGDDDTATSKLGEAVRMAQEAGDRNKLDLLEGVVDIVDAGTGTVKLRSDIAVIDETLLDAGSTKTDRVK